MTYKLTKKAPEGDEFIIRKSDGAWIPKCEDNRDYQEYLEWVSKGNTPEEAD